MVAGIHALMQDSDDSDAVARRPEIDDVLLDATPPIPGANMCAILRALRRFRQIGTGCVNAIGILQGLR